MPTASKVFQYFSERLAESGLDEDDAAKLGFRPVDSAKFVHPSYDPRPGFVIPYREPLTGKPLTSHPGRQPHERLRYLGPELPGFKAVAEHKPHRYVQPPGSGVAAYFPLLGVDWREIITDPKVPIVITEGEIKAACACKHGFRTIGLGGVWSWLSKAACTRFLPELEKVTWANRLVYMAYDSDLRTNSKVASAVNALAEALFDRGANPYLVNLPNPKDQEIKKIGLDDFLVAEGPDAFESLLDLAQPLTLARALWAMNNEVAYVRDPGLVIVRGTRQRMTPSSFTSHAFTARPYYEIIMGKDGETRMVKADGAAAWLTWPSAQRSSA